MIRFDTVRRIETTRTSVRNLMSVSSRETRDFFNNTRASVRVVFPLFPRTRKS